MIRGISKDDILRYVPECERDLLPEEQTVFWIRPRTGADANAVLSKYSPAMKDEAGGRRSMDVQRMNSADLSNFLTAVQKVENFLFAGEESPTAEIQEEDGLTRIWKQLEANILTEVLNASADFSRLRREQKKS